MDGLQLRHALILAGLKRAQEQRKARTEARELATREVSDASQGAERSARVGLPRNRASEWILPEGSARGVIGQPHQLVLPI